uniref:hypothetical protein n=1 Tax=Lachnoclostridium phocaeense TaxID=1871021 RepID=UPI0026DC417F|nr:hypothetical protein [Lachnoclostridium phocaeense]
MKRRVVYALLVCLMAVTLATGCNKEETSEGTAAPAQKEEGIEPYQDNEKFPDGCTLIDYSESYTEEELKQYAADITQILSDYYGVMYNFTHDTEDYSDTLAGYFGTSECFEGNHAARDRNFYKIFKGLNMESTFDSYVLKELALKKDTILPEVDAIGYVKADFKNDRVEEGRYCVQSKVTLIMEEGTWKLYKTETNVVYKEKGMELYKATTAKDGILFKGTNAITWDVIHPDEFLKNGGSDISVNEEDYDQVIDY